ncbi:MAG: XdhC family protein, partial [Candidatus Heimdallarchaeaceae archaeon]
MNEQQFWKTAHAFLGEGKDIVIVVMIQRIGSAPNVPGSKMLVTTDTLIGTVGGGISEHRLANQAHNLLGVKKPKVETVFLDHSEGTQEHHSGMICSGSQTFALLYLGIEDITVVEEIYTAFSKANPGVLALTADGIEYKSGETLQEDNYYTKSKTGWEYRENVGLQERLIIIGGGHVSLALSKIMETLDFHITILDDRLNLPTMKNNSFAHEKHVISYDNILSYIPEGRNVYVTIMTYGHSSDELVLEKLISKKYRYIGMMASVFKKQQ